MAFNGQLRSNEIFSALYNMIISQQVFADNIKGTQSKLVDHFKVDGTLYGDTKLYYASDCLKSSPWGNDAEASNLLALHRPEAPEVQAITISNFRQIALTVDNYLSKRAFSTEGTFSSFNSVMLGWIRDTKRIYESTLVNAYVGTVETSLGEQQRLVEEDANATLGQNIGLTLANLFVELSDVSRDFNDYGFIRSYNMSDLMVVWNSKYVNEVKKIDLPVLFHNQGLIEKFEDYTLPSRFFGAKLDTAGTANGTSDRTLVEGDFTGSDGVLKHLFPGDLIPAGADYLANEAYSEASDVVCKIMHKTSVPFMSAFEVGTSFFNPKSLTENHYLTWGYSDIDYLKNYPMITVKKA